MSARGKTSAHMEDKFSQSLVIYFVNFFIVRIKTKMDTYQQRRLINKKALDTKPIRRFPLEQKGPTPAPFFMVV